MPTGTVKWFNDSRSYIAPTPTYPRRARLLGTKAPRPPTCNGTQDSQQLSAGDAAKP
jgi:hypothetical protein